MHVYVCIHIYIYIERDRERERERERKRERQVVPPALLRERLLQLLVQLGELGHALLSEVHKLRAYDDSA